MTKNTFDLYRCSPLLWANLKYKEALVFRIEKANNAMNYYRSLATIADKSTDKYKDYMKKYIDSEKAKDWNKDFLQEIINEPNKKG